MPLTTRYTAARHLARNAGLLAHEFFAHRHFMFAGHTAAEDFGARSVGTIRALIAGRLAAAFPEDTIVDAGIASTGDMAPARTWRVDPIDGAENFRRGIPFYSVAIAYMEGECCEIGVVYDPEHDELFHARRGDGAWCEHAGSAARLEVGACAALDGALLCVAHDERHPDPGYLAFRHELMDLGASVRAMGSHALEQAQVAAGRCDGFVALHADPRRLCAGMLLIAEAGGFALQQTSGDHAHAGAPVVGAPHGIAASLTDAARLWFGRHGVDERSAPDRRAH